MSTTSPNIRDLALQLPPQDRALLACELLDSLEPADSESAIDTAWIEEIEARAEAYATGQAPADDWQVSLERARRRLREGRPV